MNWSCSLITPEAVRREWAEEYGLEHVTSKVSFLSFSFLLFFFFFSSPLSPFLFLTLFSLFKKFSDSIEEVMKDLNMQQNHQLDDSKQNKILIEVGLKDTLNIFPLFPFFPPSFLNFSPCLFFFFLFLPLLFFSFLGLQEVGNAIYEVCPKCFW